MTLALLGLHPYCQLFLTPLSRRCFKCLVLLSSVVTSVHFHRNQKQQEDGELLKFLELWFLCSHTIYSTFSFLYSRLCSYNSKKRSIMFIINWRYSAFIIWYGLFWRNCHSCILWGYFCYLQNRFFPLFFYSYLSLHKRRFGVRIFHSFLLEESLEFFGDYDLNIVNEHGQMWMLKSITCILGCRNWSWCFWRQYYAVTEKYFNGFVNKGED